MSNLSVEIKDIYEYSVSSACPDIAKHEIYDKVDAIKYCIQGVENNNDINGENWSDWYDGTDIANVYLDGIENYQHDAEITEALDTLLKFVTKKYMHTVSGDVATVDKWIRDYLSTDIETWFGLEYDQCKHMHWLYEQKYLVAV